MPDDDPELIEVRTDERFDLERLGSWLRGRLPGAEGALWVRQFGGGHANLSYLLRFGDREFVLRRPPLGPIAPSSHDMAREHRVLRAVPDAFPLAPRSYVYCDDPAIIGADFHVLERRPGIIIHTELPATYLGRPALNRGIGEMLIDVLAELHRVDPAAVGLDQLGHPEGFVRRQLEGWIRRWQAAKDREVAAVDQVIEWLSAAPPDSPRVSLLHNDYKLDNMMVDAADPSRPTAVLDWDMCTRGDPLMDLGYLLNFWVEADDDPAWFEAAAMPTWHPGFPTRAQAIARYGERTGFDLERVRWYQVFGTFKLAVVLQQIYVRFQRGQTQDQRFAELDRRVAALADKAAVLTAG